jgi:hypothetical protein
MLNSLDENIFATKRKTLQLQFKFVFNYNCNWKWQNQSKNVFCSWNILFTIENHQNQQVQVENDISIVNINHMLTSQL